MNAGRLFYFQSSLECIGLSEKEHGRRFSGGGCFFWELMDVIPERGLLQQGGRRMVGGGTVGQLAWDMVPVYRIKNNFASELALKPHHRGKSHRRRKVGGGRFTGLFYYLVHIFLHCPTNVLKYLGRGQHR